MNVRVLLTAAVLLAGVATLPGHGQEPKEELPALMKKKLASSQRVLEGLATGDLGTVSTHALELIRISKAVEFRVLKTPQYELHSTQFRNAAEMLDEMARGKNADGAGLAYVELTLSCLKCHKHVREARLGGR